MHDKNYQLFAESLRWLAEHYDEQPSLSEIAAHSGVSEHHFQRQFSKWVGVSPKRFVEHLSVGHARKLLDAGESVLDTSFETGLSSPSRLHDLFIRHEAMTPGEYKLGGLGLSIKYGVHAGPFGETLVGTSKRGLVALTFVGAEGSAAAIATMQRRLPKAEYLEDRPSTLALLEQIFAPARGGELHLLLAGSPFQLSVWHALLRLPIAARCSYGQLARSIDKVGAARAVGTAVGANPLALLIPCHRVIRADTGQGGYRWGLERKLALQAWELGMMEFAAN